MSPAAHSESSPPQDAQPAKAGNRPTRGWAPAVPAAPRARPPVAPDRPAVGGPATGREESTATAEAEVEAKPPEPEVFRTEIPLRWSDMDALRHVNNVVYLELLEEARVRMLSSLHHAGGPDIGLVVGRNEIDYLRPLRYSQDPVVVNVWVERIGRASFTVAYQVLDPKGLVVVQAKTVVVSVNTEGTGSSPLPDEARRLLGRYLRQA